MAELLFVDPGLREFTLECPACAREAEPAAAEAAVTTVAGDIPLDRDWADVPCPRGHAIRVVREGSEGARH